MIVTRPEPLILKKKLKVFDNTTTIKATISALEAGDAVVINSFYSDGLLLLNALQVHLKKEISGDSYLEQRSYRSAYRNLSNLVLIEINEHRLITKKSPVIGWFEKLYPDIKNFLLPFPQVQGLNSAWQWYKNGIKIPLLRNKIHPYYGTYFPTRFEHLELFDAWLKRYDGPKKTAIDIGFGSGVLSLQMITNGFQNVFGTDINPNAIIGLTEFMVTTKLSRKITLDFGYLFGKWKKPTELIVFNPPWLPQSYKLDRLDEAIYYTKELFPDFFREAKLRLLPTGKLVLIFSNLAQISNVTKLHPIAQELAHGGRFKLEKLITKNVKTASKKTNRNQYWRISEKVELWILTHA
ncbi:methyltransferase [Aquimarina sp. W85]|uniref:methyltransferase n=1 Tax=Aquimarina rhodophyticola TaxID=3342246 RepID=UPI00367232D1